MYNHQAPVYWNPAGMPSHPLALKRLLEKDDTSYTVAL